jgi:hypothetical protein
VPKNSRQKRFTVTRAVSGFFGSTSQFARSSRVACGRRSRVCRGSRERRLHDLAGIVHPVAARQNPRIGGRDRLGHHHARDGDLH